MKNINPIKQLLASACMLMALCCPLALHAQSNLKFDLAVEFEPNSMSNYTADTAKCIITVYDTLNISKVHIKVTRFDNQQVVLQQAFAFDSNIGLPNGCSWKRKANVITLVLGNFAVHIYDMELALEDKSHNMGPTVLFYR